MADPVAAVAVCNELCQFARAVADFTMPAIAAIVGLVAKKVMDRLALDKDAMMRQLVDRGLQRGFEHAREVAHQYALNMNDLQVRNAMANHAAIYAASSFPDAVKHFKLDEKRDRLVQQAFAMIDTPAAPAAEPLRAATISGVTPGLHALGALGDGAAPRPPKASSGLLSLL